MLSLLIYSLSPTLLSYLKKMSLNTIEEIIQDIRAGKMVIIMDDEDREKPACVLKTSILWLVMGVVSFVSP